MRRGWGAGETYSSSLAATKFRVYRLRFFLNTSTLRPFPKPIS